MASQDIAEFLVDRTILADQQVEATTLILQYIVKELAEGKDIITLSVYDLIPLSPRGIEVLKTLIEQVTNTRFDCVYNPDGTITFVVPKQMSPPDRTDVTEGTEGTDDDPPEKKDGKVKRPKNAFVIYRLRHHKSIRDRHPGIHNNQISKVIGRMWAEEPPSVKRQYKIEADAEKRQHSIDHPGYQYQPRKPSEKKKRMTKTKLAKMAAQSGDANAAQATSGMAAQQDLPTAVDDVAQSHQNNVPRVTTLSTAPAATFNVLPDAATDDALRAELDFFNAQQLQVSNMGLDAPSAVFASVPLLEGQQSYTDENDFGFPTYDAVQFPTWVAEAADQTVAVDEYAEQRRQAELDADFNVFFDLEQDIPANFDPTQLVDGHDAPQF